MLGVGDLNMLHVSHYNGSFQTHMAFRLHTHTLQSSPPPQ